MYKELLVYIVRHGETNKNVSGVVAGQTDLELNDAGRVQARLTARSLKDVHFIKAYCSDSPRATDTFRAIVDHHPNCEIIIDLRIRERDIGHFGRIPEIGPVPLGVETLESLEDRMEDFWKNVIEPLLSPSAITSGSSGDTNISPHPASLVDPVAHHPSSRESRAPAILIVSHGATISRLLRYILLPRPNYTAACAMPPGLYNGSISIMRIGTATVIPQPLPSGDGNGADKSEQQPGNSVLGVLLSYASIVHLTEDCDTVTENEVQVQIPVIQVRIEAYIPRLNALTLIWMKATSNTVELQN
ncbi:unnamed protein product [Rhizoctonia solani]|uniref:Fructose-2,6-bisphosphatase TIGAR n=1 Tax=Rhizoctonia solani TaxID=456999 RepID=A0A8H3BZM7_9AGAM|nr:unnamed protein product [Rhizoctonia solani]